MEIAITKNTTTLERLECIITRNLQSFYEVGSALLEIRNRGFYRDVLGFETFEAYCKKRWDFTRMYAHYLIESSKVIDNVNNCLQKPTTESQARPLTRLKPQQQREAWTKAVETAPNGKVTAAYVKKVVKEMTSPAPAPEPKKPGKKIQTPMISHEPVGESFQKAFKQMVEEIKNARALKWKETSHKGALGCRHS